MVLSLEAVRKRCGAEGTNSACWIFCLCSLWCQIWQVRYNTESNTGDYKTSKQIRTGVSHREVEVLLY